MGEGADEIDGSEPLDATDEDDEIAAARGQIEQTRAEMSETIDALQDKLSPEHLKEQAKESVRAATVGKATEALSTARRKGAEAAINMSSTAKGAGSAAGQRVKENPFPLAGAGITLLGLVIGVQLIRARRQRSAQVSRRSATSGGQALNWIQRMVGQVAEQAQRTGARVIGGGQDQMIQRDTEGPDHTQATAILGHPVLDTPLTVADLVAGVGVAIGLAILRRTRKDTGDVRHGGLYEQSSG